MPDSYTGVYVLYVDETLIDRVFSERSLSVEELLDGTLSEDACKELNVPVQNTSWTEYPNTNFVLKSVFRPKKSALVRLSKDCKRVEVLWDYNKTPLQGLKPRNKEQNMLLNALMDDEIACVVVEGKAGSGKTLCALAVALDCIGSPSSPYKKIVLTRPMSSVGAPLGALPGDQAEKFLPYLGNYFSNFEFLLGKHGLAYLKTMMEKGDIEILPLQLIGGISWHDTLVIADEVQSLNAQQMYALGTRPAANSKLILLGDSAQRYGRFEDARHTGLWKIAHSEHALRSPLVSYIKLLKQERHPLADVFYNTFVNNEVVE